MRIEIPTSAWFVVHVPVKGMLVAQPGSGLQIESPAQNRRRLFSSISSIGTAAQAAFLSPHDGHWGYVLSEAPFGS